MIKLGGGLLRLWNNCINWYGLISAYVCICVYILHVLVFAITRKAIVVLPLASLARPISDQATVVSFHPIMRPIGSPMWPWPLPTSSNHVVVSWRLVLRSSEVGRYPLTAFFFRLIYTCAFHPGNKPLHVLVSIRHRLFIFFGLKRGCDFMLKIFWHSQQLFFYFYFLRWPAD